MNTDTEVKNTIHDRIHVRKKKPTYDDRFPHAYIDTTNQRAGFIFASLCKLSR